MPRAELILWSRLRRKQVLGQRFRRQYSVGPYVIDFYCPAVGLAIEVDGDTHNASTEGQDHARQEFIETYGIRFLRFTNADVFENLDSVLTEIYDTLLRLRQGGEFEEGIQGEGR